MGSFRIGKKSQVFVFTNPGKSYGFGSTPSKDFTAIDPSPVYQFATWAIQILPKLAWGLVRKTGDIRQSRQTETENQALQRIGLKTDPRGGRLCIVSFITKHATASGVLNFLDPNFRFLIIFVIYQNSKFCLFFPLFLSNLLCNSPTIPLSATPFVKFKITEHGVEKNPDQTEKF